MTACHSKPACVPKPTKKKHSKRFEDRKLQNKFVLADKPAARRHSKEIDRCLRHQRANQAQLPSSAGQASATSNPPKPQPKQKQPNERERKSANQKKKTRSHKRRPVDPIVRLRLKPTPKNIKSEAQKGTLNPARNKKAQTLTQRMSSGCPLGVPSKGPKTNHEQENQRKNKKPEKTRAGGGCFQAGATRNQAASPIKNEQKSTEGTPGTPWGHPPAQTCRFINDVQLFARVTRRNL